MIDKNYTCETCVKNDVCSIQNELHKALEDIETISQRTNVFINATVHCSKYAPVVKTSRSGISA